jgi:hypothetical protein
MLKLTALGHDLSLRYPDNFHPIKKRLGMVKTAKANE